MKKLMLILGLGIILLCGATAQAGFMMNDMFNEFNTDLWTDASHDGGWTNVENGYLGLGTTEGTRWGRARINSVFNMTGGFETYLDYDLYTFDDFYGSACLYIWAQDGSFGMRMARTYQFDGNNYYEANYQINGNWQGDYFGLTNDMTGKLRIARTDNYLGAYYWSGSAWVLASGAMLPDGYNSPVNVIFEIGNDGPAGNAPGVEVHYDNFYAHADEIGNIDSKYITAAPEPGTFILLGFGLLGLGAINRARRR